MNAVVQVEDLKAAYGDFVLLEHVGFEVRRGEVFAILGGSGCGKSTLLKHLIGLIEPAAGRIRVAGENLEPADPEAYARILQKIGVMYQGGALFGSLTLVENIMLPLEEFTPLPRPARERIAQMKLELVGLSGFAGHRPAEISGGMQKRAAIARAMALDPEILFLDEPSAGLDPITSAELDRTILRLNQNLGMTFVIVSHELASVFAVASRAIMLDARAKGIIAEGNPNDLRDHCDIPEVRAFFQRQPAPDSP
ncbi:MAG: ATP-binding cassette domain-containing protein [Terrimicrobiaceae bacterium]|nr:ATP-binding cassette domain-containing protein [Terrimicrobiaceae bacterium]